MLMWKVDNKEHEALLVVLNQTEEMKDLRTNVVAWWSGGITSAVACYWAVKTFKDVDVVFLDTRNEHTDTYRFFDDCEELYQQPIEILSNVKFKNIREVWRKYGYLNNATGA